MRKECLPTYSGMDLEHLPHLGVLNHHHWLKQGPHLWSEPHLTGLAPDHLPHPQQSE